MFFTYLRRELRRRQKQAIVVAVGLAIGIGLVVTVSAASAGVKTAQGKVLHSLYGVGTDMTVSRSASAGSDGSGQHFAFGGGSGARPPSSGSRPAAGTHVSRNSLQLTPGSSTLSQSDVSKVASLKDAKAATGGLELTDTLFSGTISRSSGSSSSAPGASSTSGASSSSRGPSSFNIDSFTVDGVQISKSGVGPVTASQVTKGRYFTAGENDAEVAVVSSSYAKQHNMSVGTKVDVSGKKLKVIGITSSTSANVFVPLGTAQKLSGLTGKVTTVYASASSASKVSALSSEVHTAVPGATVSTSSSLANQVSGSLSSASSLATQLGKWMSIAALAVAFIVAGLLMMATISRRVREFGTLKAIGWRTRRVVGQVMGEGLVIGLGGGLAGLVLGVAGAEVITAISPSLKATVDSGGSSSGGGFGRGLAGDAHSALVHLTAPLQGETIALAIALAILGGLIAGGFGAWRAARMRPAAALRALA